MEYLRLRGDTETLEYLSQNPCLYLMINWTRISNENNLFKYDNKWFDHTPNQF